MIIRLLGLAALCALLFTALGIWVTHHPLSRLDLGASAVRGTNVALATVFTNSGYGAALTVLGIGTLAGALALRASVQIPLIILCSQLVSQGAVNVIKGLFARARPEAWTYRHEAGFSYPSGHATTTIVFYGAWLLVLCNSSLPLPVRIAGAVLLGAWMIGITWSRVVLGAHYPTDVIGGLLFGIAWLCATIALIAARNPGLVTRNA